MGNEVATSKDFQERMFERIRAQMGDLLTDDDLKKIVASAVEKAFFEPVRGEYGRSEDPLFVKMMRSEVAAKVTTAVSTYLQEHPEAVEKVIREVLGGGFFQIIEAHFAAKMSWPLQQFAEQLRAKGVLGS